MSPHAYTEDQLVEQPAIGLFAALGWQTVSAMEETFGAGGTLGRETKGEAVLADRLRAALIKLNADMPDEAIQTAIDELARDRSAMSLAAANREVYRLLKEGIPVSIPDREHGGQKTERLHVLDWEHPEQNDFVLVSQFSVVGSALHLPARSGGLRQRPAAGGHRTQETRRAGARGVRRESHPLQAADSSALLVQRPADRLVTAPTVASAHSPPTGNASSSGSALSAKTSRVACRWK